MNKKGFSLSILALVLLLIIFSVGFAFAQGGSGPREGVSPANVEAISNYIPIQGRLMNSAGQALNGTYTLTFRLYEVQTGGSSLCHDSNNVVVENGLFSTYMRADSCPIDGRQLYLGIEVGDDGEMAPRKYIDNVPYAWSLRPGAKVEYNLSDPILTVNNLGSGPAISAGGRITSTEPSYVWISGNGVRPMYQTDTTIIDMTNYGGASIKRGGPSVLPKNVMLPITIPGTLYGQPARVSALDLYWKGQTEFDGITAVLMRRQTGVCDTSQCYESILQNFTDHVCDVGNNPTGCILHFDLTSNNVLSASSGVLYLTLELSFSGEVSYIEIGGVRLTLEYDD